MTPAARDCMKAALLCATPRLVEPVFLAEVHTEESELGRVHGVFSTRRGYVFSESSRPNSPQFILKAYLPVLEYDC